MATAADLAKQERKPRHIGDGVYASFDGYQIWLRVDREFGMVHEVALATNIVDELQRYISDLFKTLYFGSL